MNTCEVCNKNEGVGVCAMPGVPMSFSYCRECLEADAHPYFAVVANTACVGGLQNAGEWWRDLVESTLKHLGKSLEQFNKDVEASIKEMDALTDDPGTRRCSFCHAPPGQPCRTVLYEEHVEHGNGKVHEQYHAARLRQEDPP